MSTMGWNNASVSVYSFSRRPCKLMNTPTADSKAHTRTLKGRSNTSINAQNTKQFVPVSVLSIYPYPYLSNACMRSHLHQYPPKYALSQSTPVFVVLAKKHRISTRRCDIWYARATLDLFMNYSPVE